MGAGTNAARIGGLAVALGIGAAVVAGNGVARADTSGESGSESSSTSSSSTDSSTSTGPRIGAMSPSTRPHTGASSTTSVDSSTGSSSETSSGSTRPDEEKEEEEEEQSKAPQAETPKAPKVSNADNAEPDNERHFEKKRSKDSHPSGSAADPVAGSTRNLDAVDATPAVRAPATASTKTVDDAPAVTDAPPASEDVPVATAPAVRQTIDVQQPKSATATATATAPHAPVDVVTTAVSSAVNALFNPFAGGAPTAPMGSPVLWTLAAARRDSLSSAPSLHQPTDPATNSLPTGATSAATVEPTVVAITQTPPLAWLQRLPVVGPLIVTPIVVLIHQIPIVSDVLHPLIGYPVQPGLPAGTPLPRDVKVISFDGTEIYVHFMPALGLRHGSDSADDPQRPRPAAARRDEPRRRTA